MRQNKKSHSKVNSPNGSRAAFSLYFGSNQSLKRRNKKKKKTKTGEIALKSDERIPKPPQRKI